MAIMVHETVAILVITIASSYAGSCKSYFHLRERCPVDYGAVLHQYTATSLNYCCFNCQRSRNCLSVMFDAAELTCQENADITDDSPLGCTIRQRYAQRYESSCRTLPNAEGVSKDDCATANNDCRKKDNKASILDCTCEIGFSCTPNNHSCVKYCEKYGRTFYSVADKCIQHVRGLTSNREITSDYESLQLCVTETSCTCRSVKYATSKGVGYWTNHTALTVPQSHAIDDCPRHVYYQRNCA